MQNRKSFSDSVNVCGEQLFSAIIETKSENQAKMRVIYFNQVCRFVVHQAEFSRQTSA